MLTLSLILRKPVLALDNSKIEGVVNDVFFDENLKTALAYDVSANGNSFVLPLKNVSAVNDAIVIADKSALLSHGASPYTDEVRHDLMNTAVYSPLGIFKGNIINVEFTPSGRVIKLITASDEFTPNVIGKIGDVILLKPSAKRTKKSFVPRPKRDYKVELFSEPDTLSTVDGNAQTANERAIDINASREETLSVQSEPLSAQSETSPEQSIAPSKSGESVSTQTPDDVKIFAKISEILETKENAAVKFGDDFREPMLSKGAFDMLLEGSNNYAFDEDSHSPTRIICDYSFLLGRVLMGDLKTYQGDMIATKGSQITDQTVLSARKAGKLVELTLLSVSSNS